MQVVAVSETFVGVQSDEVTTETFSEEVVAPEGQDVAPVLIEKDTPMAEVTPKVEMIVGEQQAVAPKPETVTEEIVQPTGARPVLPLSWSRRHLFIIHSFIHSFIYSFSFLKPRPSR